MKFRAFPSPSGHGWVSARQTYCGGFMAVTEFPSELLALQDAQRLQGEWELQQEREQQQRSEPRKPARAFDECED